MRGGEELLEEEGGIESIMVSSSWPTREIGESLVLK
jgi:hypothetical protein